MNTLLYSRGVWKWGRKNYRGWLFFCND